MTTDSTNAARAQYMHVASVALSDVSEIGYWTKQNAASFAGGDASFQLPVFLNGGTDGFTTLVFEPYWQNGGSPDAAPVVTGSWQSWDVAGGLFWSSRSVTCSNGALLAGAGGPPLYTLQQVEAMCPDPVTAAFGVDIGTYNPSYDVEVDLVDFNGTVYDFEPYEVATTGDRCKNGGWQDVRRADGSTFKNQGDCIQYVNTGK